MRRALCLVAAAAAACGSEIHYIGTSDGGSPWEVATGNLAGLSSECGNMSFLSSRPDTDMLIAGIALRGLWASANGSNSFTQLGSGAGSAAITNRTSSIVYDPDHPGVFYETGLYNGGAVYKTDDSGATFTQLGAITHSDGASVDFSDPLRRTLLAGGHEQVGTLYRSTDSGASWNPIGGTLPSDAGFSSVALVIDAQTHLLGTYSGSGSGVFRTINGGSGWTRVYSGGVRWRPLIASDGSMYWLLDNNAGMIRSVDKGVTWTKTVGQGTVVSTPGGGIVEIAGGRLVTLGSNRLMMSADHGTTWTAFGSILPYAPTGFVYSRFRKAFYLYRFDCTFGSSDPVPADAIQKMAFDDTTQ